MSGAERLAALLNGIGLLAGLPVGYLLYHTHGIEGLAWGRFVVLAVAGITPGLATGGWGGASIRGQPGLEPVD